MFFQSSMGGGMDADDLMAQMMGGGGGGGLMEAMMMSQMGGGMRRGPKKGRDVGVRMGVTLEELYNGKTKEFEMDSQQKCPQCAGNGTKSGRPSICNVCNGKGVVIRRRMIGPGMVQQVQVACDNCGGTGKVIEPGDQCPMCEGKCYIETKEKFQVKIRPGMRHKEQIPFRQRGDWSPEIDIPGDVVFVLEQKPHDDYTVKGNDLHITKTITLVQALTGFELEHTHLDDRKLILKGQSNRVVVPGTVQVIEGEGLPTNRGDHGDLIVTFDLEFPRMLDEDQVEKLRQALPGPKKQAQYEDLEECFMDDYTPEQWKQMGAVGEDEEEDAEEEGGGGVRCAHQ